MDQLQGVRIEDLANPKLSDLQRAAIDFCEKHPVDLSLDSILDVAIQRTGLNDFGQEDFRVRLQVWLQAVNEDQGLNELGRVSIRSHLVRILSNRLCVENVLKRFPEIASFPIKRPIIVAGLPRSGTTHLLNLMATDSRLRSIPYWESMEPVPLVGEGPNRDGRDSRYERCRIAYERSTALTPLLRAMHDMPPEHIHEEIELLEIDFASYHLEWLCVPPRWRDYYLSLDLCDSYLYLRKVLQVLQYFRGSDRFVLKCPQHLEQIKPLMAAFPDATVVITHRDPVAVIQSTITMLAYGDRMRRKQVNPSAVAEYWIDRVERMLRACVRDRELLPKDQSVDVLFHQFMEDDIATVEKIYRTADLLMMEATHKGFRQFMRQNPRGKYGRVHYDLMRDFGCDPQAVRQRLDFYCKRFPVAVEV